MIGRWGRSLRVQLAAVGFLAIYAPLLLVLGVDVATDEEVTTTVEGTRRVVSSDAGSSWLTVTVVLLAPVALGLAWWWAGRATRPLDRVRRVADEIGDTDLSRRIALDHGPTEVAALAASFDAMLDRLEDAAATQQRLVEETSHELRTPLAVLTTNAEVLLAHDAATVEEHRVGWERTRRAATGMAATVDALLVEARGRARTIDRHPADLVATVRAVVDERAPSEVVVRVEGAERAVVAVDEPTVRRAVANLVDNAVRVAPRGTAVEVTVGDGWVIVDDHGPGLSAEGQVRVFDRFWRGDEGGGAGLGIPIAAQVARAHGGDLTVASPGPAGDGCSFTLTLTPPRQVGSDPT